MKLSEEVAAVISRMTFHGAAATLPPGQLDRALYTKVDAALNALGGTWNRKLKVHAFPDDAKARVTAALNAGSVTTDKDMEFFPTPAWLAEDIVALADLKPGMSVLEPSAGDGALVREILKYDPKLLVAHELDPRHVKGLIALTDQCDGTGVTVCGDFLQASPQAFPLFDRVVMNPPFSKHADVIHVTHALRFLKTGGKLVAIMAAGVTFKQYKRTKEFRALVERHRGTITPLSDGAFKDAGTNVKTVVVQMTVPT